MYNFGGLDLPTVNPFVQTMLQGLKRLHAKPVQKKPMTVPILADMVEDANSALICK